MKLALFEDNLFGVITHDGLWDVTEILPQYQTGYAANFWVCMCRDFEELRPKIQALVKRGDGLPLEKVRLRSPVLNPTKVIAAASNYGSHVDEMRDRGAPSSWLLDFDVFLKSPSSIIGPGETIHLPDVQGEIHHESELAVVIGKAGKNISEAEAMGHVLGYTIAIDVTLRGKGDRSRRKSYDGFTPVGPWLVTADEIPDPHALSVKLWVNGQLRQDANTGDMLVKIPGIIAFASSVMTLNPGDLISTGSPPGVGEIHPGDHMAAEISGIGRLEIPVAGKPIPRD